jgi:hypothetical protein
LKQIDIFKDLRIYPLSSLFDDKNDAEEILKNKEYST